MGDLHKTRLAAKNAGQKRYFTGKPCKQGHVAERTTVTGKCTECRFPSSFKHREYNARWKAKYPGREQEVKYRFRYGVELSEIRPKPECCEACGQKHTKIVLDHCHETGAFRGWLCDPCNVVLGLVKDDPARLEALAEHLRQPNFSNYVNLVKTQNNVPKG